MIYETLPHLSASKALKIGHYGDNINEDMLLINGCASEPRRQGTNPSFCPCAQDKKGIRCGNTVQEGLNIRCGAQERQGHLGVRCGNGNKDEVRNIGGVTNITKAIMEDFSYYKGSDARISGCPHVVHDIYQDLPGLPPTPPTSPQSRVSFVFLDIVYGKMH